MPISVRKIESLSSLSEFAHRRWVYRGQREVGWKLLTSLDRCLLRYETDQRNRVLVEAELQREFRRTYHQYAVHIPRDDSILEWLSLMQHYGAPTRLLDFSYSIWVAAYFALESADGDACIWAINASWTLDETIKSLQSIGKSDAPRLAERFYEKHESLAEDLFFKSPFVDSVCVVNPFRLNDRLRTQKGVFLIAGNVLETFENNLKSLRGYDDSRNIVQIVLPKQMRRQAIEALFEMNISRTSLFPGLDGFAQSLAIYSPALNPQEWKGSPETETKSET
jgi:FRG domain